MYYVLQVAIMVNNFSISSWSSSKSKAVAQLVRGNRRFTARKFDDSTELNATNFLLILSMRRGLMYLSLKWRSKYWALNTWNSSWSPNRLPGCKARQLTALWCWCVLTASSPYAPQRRELIYKHLWYFTENGIIFILIWNSSIYFVLRIVLDWPLSIVWSVIAKDLFCITKPYVISFCLTVRCCLFLWIYRS